tara:strand:- start:135 stop:389 length:255 start_codon:yes stop_codon:yes gene_type:complete
MKIIQNFIIALLLCSIVIIFTPAARAYEQDQLAECILSAKENELIKGVPEGSIEKYCDCALDLIFDQRKDIRESGYKCAEKSFG